jgi:hypothetical protein
MGAAADCELIGPGFLGQPVNTLTTLALVVAGGVLLTRARLRWIGVGLIATAAGSFLFHGPMPSGSEWAHDVSLAWLILLVAGLGRSWETWTRIPGLVALGVLFAALPAVADPVAVLITIAALILILRDDRSPSTIAPLGLLGAAAILGRLGATGGPFCDPGSLFQLHGVWHIAAAGAVTWWALAVEPRLAT